MRLDEQRHIPLEFAVEPTPLDPDPDLFTGVSLPPVIEMKVHYRLYDRVTGNVLVYEAVVLRSKISLEQLVLKDDIEFLQELKILPD